MSDPHGNEEWRPVVGYEGFYSVSNHGRVRRDAAGCGTVTGKILKPQVENCGHLHVGLSVNGKVKIYRIHTIVLFAFIGPPQLGQMCRHWDDNPANNHIRNLLWGTHLENHDDRKRNGKQITGSEVKSSKLTEPEVEAILCLRKRGWSQQKVANAFCVHRTAIASIDQGRSWNHVPR